MFIQIKKLSYVISLLFLIVHIPYSYTTEASSSIDPTFVYNDQHNLIYMNLTNTPGTLLKTNLEKAFNKDKNEEGLFKHHQFDDICVQLDKNRTDGCTHFIQLNSFLDKQEVCVSDSITFNIPFFFDSHLLRELFNHNTVKQKISDWAAYKTNSPLIQVSHSFNLRIHEVTKENNALKNQIKKKDEENPNQDKTITQQKYIIVLLILLIGVREMLHFYH